MQGTCRALQGTCIMRLPCHWPQQASHLVQFHARLPVGRLCSRGTAHQGDLFGRNGSRSHSTHSSLPEAASVVVRGSNRCRGPSIEWLHRLRYRDFASELAAAAPDAHGEWLGTLPSPCTVSRDTSCSASHDLRWLLCLRLRSDSSCASWW